MQIKINTSGKIGISFVEKSTSEIRQQIDGIIASIESGDFPYAIIEIEE